MTKIVTGLLVVVALLAGWRVAETLTTADEHGITPGAARDVLRQAHGHAHPHDHALLHVHDGEGPCVCDRARLVNGWCPACRVGHVAGVRIVSADLFEALDAHGHDFDPAVIECASCRDAIADGGFCDRCGFGFAGGRLYVSRLTWWLGRGTARDPTSLDCPTCREAARATGWCDRCGVGMVGTFEYRDRRHVDAAGREYERLLDSIEIGRGCDGCAVASYMEVPCVTCGVTYQTEGAGS